MSLFILALWSTILALCLGIIGFCVGMALGLRRVQQVNEHWYSLLVDARSRYETAVARDRERPPRLRNSSNSSDSGPGGIGGPRSVPLSRPLLGQPSRPTYPGY